MSKPHTRIHNLIDEFLTERRESRGGWAEVTKDDVKLLSKIISALIKAKCEEDPDGDFPIEFLLINRRVERLPYFDTVPYPNFEAEDRYENTKKGTERSFFNLSTAFHDYETWQGLLRHEEYLFNKDKDPKPL
jgi:hypothetical protein